MLPNIPTFFGPVLSSRLTYFTCGSQFFLSILQCQGEWCHQHNSCPFPSGIHKWIIFYFQRNNSVLPDCLGLCECQRILPPHTFLWASYDFHSVSPVKRPSPTLSAGNVDCSHLPDSWCFLTRLDEVLTVWFSGWKSLKSEFLCLC